jgi:signal peptidase II
VFGILITHRIAGPIYKFERYLESIARGEEQGDCKLRKGDELHDLCERLNTAVRALK